ncbi:MAG: cobaltochelatase subunit CobN, partial [Pseudomonadota bacterium]
MHLLAATPGAIDDGKEPVDLGQTPADIVVISAADTELAALSEARATMDAPPDMRLANMMHLQHPMSVDLHLDNCATKSKLVIARILGGASYWSYGFTQYAARLRETGVPFIALPGDDKPDQDLRDLSTCSPEDYDALWSYLVEGGPENNAHFLQYAQAMINGGSKPPLAKPLLRAGVYWPGDGITDAQSVHTQCAPGAPRVYIVFYRALVQGGGLGPINRLTRSLLRAGLQPVPVFGASLKDPLSIATLEQVFKTLPPDVILNCTAFAVGSAHGDIDGPENPLTMDNAQHAPVFQVILSGASEEAWSESPQGLSARDIAMNVALPEVDGRVLSRAISFKGQAYFDEATECPIVTPQARGDRIDFVTALTKNWARLRQTPEEDKKTALILANYPNKDGRLANGVGLDTPAATVHVLNLLKDAGFTVSPPEDSATLMKQILAGPTNWLTDRADKEGGAFFPLADYSTYFNTLPWDLKDAITARWGAPSEDPFISPKQLNATDAPTEGFALSIHDFGNAVVGIQPARGYNIDPTETYHAPDLVPPHNYLAFYFYLRHHWGADAIVHMGKHGNLEWLPGKATALSETCWPEAVFGPTPHFYPFIVNDPGEGTQAKRRTAAVIVDHLTPPLTRAESYGPLRDLEALVDEYYEAAGVDPRRIDHLRREILSLSDVTGLAKDAGFEGDAEGDLAKLDAYLCELKEAQIRDGLHIFGQAPEGDLATNLAIALARVPRGDGKDKNASLLRAFAADLGLNIDPLNCDLAAPATERPAELLGVSSDTWRSNGDTVERLELLSQQTIRDGGRGVGACCASPPVLQEVYETI